MQGRVRGRIQLHAPASRWLAMGLLCLSTSMLMGGSCHLGASDSPPPLPPNKLAYPNGYNCPLLCYTQTLGKTVEVATPVCVPPFLNSNLPGAPPFDPYNWQTKTESHCNDVVRAGAERILNQRLGVCDTKCMVRDTMPGSYAPIRDKQCNEKCEPIEPACDDCFGRTNCSQAVCVPSGRVDPPLAEVFTTPVTNFEVDGTDDFVTLTLGNASISVPVRGIARLYGVPCQGTCDRMMSVFLVIDPFEFQGRRFERFIIRSGGHEDFPVVQTVAGVLAAPAAAGNFTVEGLTDGTETYIASKNDMPIMGSFSQATGQLYLSAHLLLSDEESLDIRINGRTPNQPPRALVASAHVRSECQGPSGASVTLDASGSSDLDNNIARYAWHRLDGLSRVFIGAGPVLTVQAPLGPSDYEVVVVDDFGASSTASVHVEVVDATPPQFDSVRVQPDCIWPPNDKWAAFELGDSLWIEIHDVCGQGKPQLRVGEVTVAEDGAAARSASEEEARVNPERAVCVRASRPGSSGEGRTYRVRLSASDLAGNTTETSITIEVPHDSRPGRRCRDSSTLSPQVPAMCLSQEDRP